MKKIGELIKDLRNDKWELRYLACKELGNRKAKSAVPDLITLLNDKNANVRSCAAYALGEIGDKRAVDPLVNAIADPNEWVRLQAVEALGKVGDSKIALLLSQFLETEKDDRVKATLIKVVGILGDARMISILVPYLKDRDMRVRANAIEALESLGDDKIREFIMPMIETSNHRIKANIAKALFNMGDYTGLNLLKRMIKDKNEWMRAAAAWALGEIKSKEAVKLLLESIGDEFWFVDKNIIKSLAKTGKSVIQPLVNLLKKKKASTRARISAIITLGEIGDKRALKHLINAMNDFNGEVRLKAEEAIDRIREYNRK